MTPSNSHFSGGPDPPRCIERSYGATTPPSLAIVQTIAVMEDVDPMDAREFGLRLYDHVDPEALDRLLEDPDGSASVSLDLSVENRSRYAVQLHENGRLVVRKSG
ncbi:HalOD1 output domain-containing protein [Natrialbaceae archaeon GCM10025810]|uniref:HalOD1 output domain-containing protein n=1 Tax=Halovalidus salilacus TaxID=3075124 RepID=UPI003607E783